MGRIAFKPSKPWEIQKVDLHSSRNLLIFKALPVLSVSYTGSYFVCDVSASCIGTWEESSFQQTNHVLILSLTRLFV